MEVAKLDRKVSIESKQITLDQVGGEVITWVPVASVWAAKRFRPGREWYQAGRTISEALVWFVLRYRADLDTTMRLVDSSEVYDILSIAPDETRKHFMQFECRVVK